MTAPNAFSLEGRRALVTGSESGLGRAIAAAFVEAGADVVGADISVAPDESGTRSPAGHVRLRFDLCDREDIARVVERAIDVLGGVDACVNCAGIGGRSPAVDYPDDLWDRLLATNLTGAFTVTKLIGAHMVAQGFGSMINIASIGGLVGFPGSVGYQASKGAIVQITRTLAVEWGPTACV